VEEWNIISKIVIGVEAKYLKLKRKYCGIMAYRESLKKEAKG